MFYRVLNTPKNTTGYSNHEESQNSRRNKYKPENSNFCDQDDFRDKKTSLMHHRFFR